MAITLTYPADAQLVGNAANLGGYGQWLLKQQAIAQEQAQFHAQQQLAQQRLAQDAAQQQFGQQFAYDQLGQRDYEFNRGLAEEQKQRQFELLKQGLGFNQDIQKAFIGAGLDAGLEDYRNAGQLRLEDVRQRGLDLRNEQDNISEAQRRRYESNNTKMFGHLEALLKEADHMSDEQWHQAFGQAREYWAKRGMEFPAEMPRPRPQATPTDDPEIAAIRAEHPEMAKVPMVRNPATGKVETPEAWFKIKEEERLREENTRKLTEAQAKITTAEEKRKQDLVKAFNTEVSRIRQSAYEKDSLTGGNSKLNQSRVDAEIDAAAKRFKAAFGFDPPLPDPKNDAKVDGSEPVVITLNDGTTIDINTPEELKAFLATHPGAKFQTPDGRPLVPVPAR